MFGADASDPALFFRYAIMGDGLFFSGCSSRIPSSWGRDQSPQFPPPIPHPLPSTLWFRSNTRSGRAYGSTRKTPTPGTPSQIDPLRPVDFITSHADKRSIRSRVGRSLRILIPFTKIKAFPRGRSSKGRSIRAMGFKPAILSERPYVQSG